MLITQSATLLIFALATILKKKNEKNSKAIQIPNKQTRLLSNRSILNWIQVTVKPTFPKFYSEIIHKDASLFL